jgi:superfamily I DNA and/or RNA helicase
MRSHIRDMDLEECKVATIEEFQGDERRVIIISMVRASQHYLNHDLKFSLGFVHNQKRFNVAVSRAMSLLICIGDPNLLSRDKYWQQFINYCLENESYNGCKFRDYNSGVVLKRSQFNG